MARTLTIAVVLEDDTRLYAQDFVLEHPLRADGPQADVEATVIFRRDTLPRLVMAINAIMSGTAMVTAAPPADTPKGGVPLEAPPAHEHDSRAQPQPLDSVERDVEVTRRQIHQEQEGR